MASIPQTADFSLTIEFEKKSSSPSRVFRAMSGLIEACQEVDRSLANAIDVKIEPILLLEDIETGSLKAWLSTILKEIDDEALKKLDWRPAVGKYLVKSKHLMVNFLDRKTEVSNHRQIDSLKTEIGELAKETNVLSIPVYQPLSTRVLLNDLRLLSDAVKPLAKTDSAVYTTPEGSSAFNLEFSIAPDTLEALVTRETTITDGPMILIVKKPDYLGESMWEFRHGSRTITAKIVDAPWLRRFQSREVEVRPGDAIRGLVRNSTSYDYDGELIGEKFEILQVVDVITKAIVVQSSLLNGEQS